MMCTSILQITRFVLLVQTIVPAVFGFSHGSSQPRVRLSDVTDSSSLSQWPVVRMEGSLLSEEPSSSPLSPKRKELPPVLQQIADEREDFNRNLGKAMDTLRKDMPEILRRLPDFSIYHDQITLVDPSGVRLTGLDKYKSAFSFFQTFIQFWFKERSGLQYRIVYDFCRSSIRVSWNAVLYPKVSVMGKPLFVDGISTYKLDTTSGKIIEHKLENLVINSKSMVPPYSIISSLLQQEIIPQRAPGVPAGVGGAI